MLWIYFGLSVIVAVVTTRVSMDLSLRLGIIDIPTSRSSHSHPVPRVGGIGIYVGFFFAFGTLLLSHFWGLSQYVLQGRDVLAVLLAGTGMAATGLYDDVRGLPVFSKFVVQLLLALVIVGLGIRVECVGVPLLGSLCLEGWSLLISIFWLTGFANLYNFMDGIDGLAGATGVAYGGFFSLIAWWQGNYALAIVALLVAGSCLGFLVYNLPPARTFMGDTGSLFLGMLFGLLIMQISQQSSNSAIVLALLLVCSMFLYDSCFTLLQRIRNRENIFRAHRSHLYQRLVQAGLSHGRVTTIYVLMHGVMGVLALAYLKGQAVAQIVILGLAASVLTAFTVGVHIFEKRRV